MSQSAPRERWPSSVTAERRRYMKRSPLAARPMSTSRATSAATRRRRRSSRHRAEKDHTMSTGARARAGTAGVRPFAPFGVGPSIVAVRPPNPSDHVPLVAQQPLQNDRPALRARQALAVRAGHVAHVFESPKQTSVLTLQSGWRSGRVADSSRARAGRRRRRAPRGGSGRRARRSGRSRACARARRELRRRPRCIVRSGSRQRGAHEPGREEEDGIRPASSLWSVSHSGRPQPSRRCTPSSSIRQDDAPLPVITMRPAPRSSMRGIAARQQ